MKKLLCAALVFLLFQQCKRVDSSESRYTFYDTSNYFIKDSIRNTVMSAKEFILIDEPGFLNHEYYDYYLIFYKKYMFPSGIVLFSLKSIDTSNTIVTKTIITFDNQLKDCKNLRKCNFSITKNSWSLNKDSLHIIRHRTNNEIATIHNYRTTGVIAENYVEMLLQQDGKYFLFNDNYTSIEQMNNLQRYFLDTLLSINSTTAAYY